MHYKIASAWLFATLALLLFLMAVYPSPYVIWAGIIGLPVLILIQAIIVLRAKDEKPQHFEEEKWYEDR